jgi:hypothetical protein
MDGKAKVSLNQHVELDKELRCPCALLEAHVRSAG